MDSLFVIWEVRRASGAANRALCVCHCCLLHLGSQILVAQNLGPLDSQEDLSVSHCPVVATPSGNLHRFVHCRSCSTLVLSLCMCMIALPTFPLYLFHTSTLLCLPTNVLIDSATGSRWYGSNLQRGGAEQHSAQPLRISRLHPLLLYPRYLLASATSRC